MVKRKIQEDSEFLINRYNRRKKTKKQKNTPPVKEFSQINKNAGKWTLEQTKLYLEFVQLKSFELSDIKYRKEMKIFKQMSVFILTRTPDQCRSHHQKIQKAFQTVDKIIRVFKKKIQEEEQNLAKDNEKTVQRQHLIKEENQTLPVQSNVYFWHMINDRKLSITINACYIEEF